MTDKEIATMLARRLRMGAMIERGDPKAVTPEFQRGQQALEGRLVREYMPLVKKLVRAGLVRARRPSPS